MNNIGLLESWKDTLRGDLEKTQEKIDFELKKKHQREERLVNQLRPILAKIAKYQRRHDEIKNKINEIDKEINKIKTEDIK